VKFDFELLLKSSLLRRNIIGHLLVLVIFCVLTIGNLLWQMQRDGVGEYDNMLRNHVTAMSTAFEQINRVPEYEHIAVLSVFVDSTILLEQALYPKLEGREISVLRVLDKGGREIYRTPRFDNFPFADDKSGHYDIDYNGESWRSFKLTNASHGMTIELAQNNITLKADLVFIVQRFVFLPFLAFIPLAALITWATSARGLRPLRQLTQLIARRSPTDMQPLITGEQYLETTPLVNEINTLLRKLEVTLNRERSFLADAAHELRTPLAVIQAQAYVLQHSVNAQAKNNAADELNYGIERAARLVDKLLTTARLSADDYLLTFSRSDLTALMQDRLATFSVLADKKCIDMALDANGPIYVRIDHESFLSAIDNVLDNAIRYSPNNTRILVEIETLSNTQVQLRIFDDGDGIPEALHERVFERFYRVAGNEQQGSGLGLAIVRRVMSLHKGAVTLSKGSRDRGLCVELTLPIALSNT
jgi:signal transduction histidine kinase